jgi:hypothetical protein
MKISCLELGAHPASNRQSPLQSSIQSSIVNSIVNLHYNLQSAIDNAIVSLQSSVLNLLLCRGALDRCGCSARRGTDIGRARRAS